MSRKPRDEVAASTTITLRLTPDDRARIDRQIEARAADLPEKSMSALLRRLVRDAEEGVSLRLPPEDRETLAQLVRARAEELAALGIHEAIVTPSSVLVGLIREAAKARGLAPAGAAPARAPAPVEPVKSAPAQKAPPAATDPDPAAVRHALQGALDRGVVQRDIARRAGIDSGHLSRFKREGKGLSPEKLVRLTEALEAKG